MTKKPTAKRDAKSAMPSYLKEAFNMVQRGKTNHHSAKNAMGAKRSKSR